MTSSITVVMSSARLMIIARLLIADQLEEAAFFSTAGLVLVQECKVLVPERVVPFIPGNFFQAVFTAVSREINPQYTGASSIVFCASYSNRFAASFFCPFTDLLQVGRSS